MATNFSQNSLQLAPSGQAQRQQKIGQMLASQGLDSSPAQGGWVEALSRVGQAYFGNQMMQDAEQQRGERQQQLAQTLQNATQATQPGATAQNPMVGPTQMSDADRMAAILSQNPDTAPMGLQLSMQQATQEPQAQTRIISGSQANKLFGTKLAPGSAVTLEAGPRGTSIKSVQQAQQRDQDDFSARNVLLPSGDKVSGRTTEQGGLQVRGSEGGWQPAPRGAQIISTSLQGSESEIGATNPEIRNFRTLEAQMPVVNRLQSRITEGLASGDYVGGISGSTLKGLNSLRNQAQQVYRQFNQDKPEGERDVKLSVDRFRPALGEVANMSNQVQSSILDLAYMTLKAKDPSGRVSDKDIERELDTFGLDTSDPSIIMERVNEKIGDLYTNYRATGKGLGIEPQYQFEAAGVPDRTGNQKQPGPTRERAQEQSDPLGIR